MGLALEQGSEYGSGLQSQLKRALTPVTSQSQSSQANYTSEPQVLICKVERM